MDNKFGSFPSGSGAGAGIADANDVARAEKQTRERILTHEQELAIGAIATALMQELLGAFPANERAKEIRELQDFKEFQSVLSTAIMQQTGLPLVDALRGMSEGLFEKFLRGNGLTIGGPTGISIELDSSIADALVEQVKEKYYR